MKTPALFTAIGLSLMLVFGPQTVGTAHASGSPAFYKISAGSAANAQTLTFNHDVGTGSNRLLIVAVVIRDAQQRASTVTYKNVAMTRLSENECRITNVTPEVVTCRQEVWYLANPAAGINQVRIDLLGSAPRTMAKATSYTGVNQTTPVGPFSWGAASSGSITATTNSLPGDLVYSTVAVTGDSSVTLTTSGGQTQRGVMTGTPNLTIGVGDKPAPSTAGTEMRWSYSSSGDQVAAAMTAFAIKPVQRVCMPAGSACSVANPIVCCSLACICPIGLSCTCG